MKRIFNLFLSVLLIFSVILPTTVAAGDEEIAETAEQYEGKNEQNFISSEFVQHVFKEAEGIILPRLASDQYELGQEINKSNLEEGDVVFFQGTYLMSGIYIGDHEFLIVTSSGIERKNLKTNSYYSTRYVGARRYNKDNTLVPVEDLGSPAAKLAVDMEGENANGFISAEFVQHVFKEAEGINLPSSSGDQYDLGEEVAKSNLQAGDVVFFQGTYLMSGVYLQNGDFLIVTSSGIERKNLETNSYYAPRYVGAKRYNEKNTLVQWPVAKLASDMEGANTNNFISSEFVQHVFKEAEGITLPRSASDQYELGDAVEKSELAPGDVLFFQGTYLMSGVYLQNGKFLIVTSSGIELKDLETNSYYSSRYVGAKRYNKGNTLVPIDELGSPAAKLAVGMEGESTNFITSEFVQYVFEEAEGIYLPRSSSDQWELGEDVAKSDLQAGDVVFIQGNYLMTGVYLQNGDFLIVLSSGIERRNLESSYYAERYVGAKRYHEDNTLTPVEDLGSPAAKFAVGMEGESTNFITSEFVQHAFEEAEGIYLPSSSAEQWELGDDIAKADLQAGDVVFIQGTYLMTGIYIQNGDFLIVLNSGIERRNLDSSYYAERYIGAKRYNKDNTLTPIDDIGSPIAQLAVELIGDNPQNFISSEFVQHVFKEAEGIELPNSASLQWPLGEDISADSLEPGDVLFFEGSSLMSAIYVQNGTFVIVTSKGIEERNLETSDFYSSRYLGAKRITAENINKEEDLTPILELADSLIGTPSSSDGSSPEEGFTSGTFVQYLFKETTGSLLSRIPFRQYEAGIPVNKDDLKQGDLVYFEGSNGLIAGIYKGDDLFITVTSNGVQERNLRFDSYYADRYYGAARFTQEILDLSNPQTYVNHENKLFQEAMKYIGTPYVLTGSTLAGFDCSYLIQLVFKDVLDIHLPRATYNQWSVGETIIAEGRSGFDVDLDQEIKPGDVIYFSNTWQEGISHTGIYLGNDYFVHASGDEGETTISFFGEKWKEHFTGVKRFDDLSLPLDNPFVYEASQLLGIEYAAGGNTPEQGFDTSGLVQYIMNNQGFDFPRYSSQQWAIGKTVARENAEIGDVMFFEGSSSLIPSIYVGGSTVILVTQSSGVRTINLDSSTYWSSRYYGTKHYKKVEETNPVGELANDKLGQTFSGTTTAFVSEVYKEALGIDFSSSVTDLWETGTPINVEDLKSGDVVFFSNGTSTKPYMSGIYTEYGDFIIISSGKVVERNINYSTYWIDRYIGARRY